MLSEASGFPVTSSNLRVAGKNYRSPPQAIAVLAGCWKTTLVSTAEDGKKNA
jgi:hypothetical protein